MFHEELEDMKVMGFFGKFGFIQIYSYLAFIYRVGEGHRELETNYAAWQIGLRQLAKGQGYV